jgi:hypothetical protein
MITELNLADPEIVGGHVIDVVESNIRSARLHRCLEQTSRLCLYMLEMDGNNTSSKVKPSEVRTIRDTWDLVNELFSFHTAEENNDLPSSNYEHAYKIVSPHQKELARVRNVKVKAILSEIWDCMNLMLSVDSANTQGYTAQEDIEQIQKRIDFVNRCLDLWMGKGADNSDTGRKVADFRILGEVQPDVDSDFAAKLEPSKKLPVAPLADVPDQK